MGHFSVQFNIYGTNRLDIVKKHLEQWRLGVEAEPVEIKQENVGR